MTAGFDWTFPLACLLVGVTAVLLCFGALVTTYDAAMAVPESKFDSVSQFVNVQPEIAHN